MTEKKGMVVERREGKRAKGGQESKGRAREQREGKRAKG
jgi:hypothetical protein